MNTGLYPILTLISRLDAGPSDSEDSSMKSFQGLIWRCMGCRIWKLRAMAARCLPCVLNPDALGAEIEAIFSGLKMNSQNELHGSLMGLQRLAEYYSKRSLKGVVFGVASLKFY